jgi:MYXO-CTERM domain-containing protein
MSPKLNEVQMKALARHSLWLIVLLISVLSQAPAFAADYIVKNDGMGDSFNGQISTVEIHADEMYAATFDLPSDWELPVELLGVRVLMVDGDNSAQNYCGRFTVEVWEESNDPFQTHTCPPSVRTKDPGAVIYSMSDQFQSNPLGFEISGNNNNLQDLRFSAVNNDPNLNVTINPVMIDTRQVRVGIKGIDNNCTTAGDAFPIMVTDDDGTAADNYVYGEALFCGAGGSVPPPEFYYWEDFRQYFSQPPGDFVMRLIFDRPDPGGDAGVGDTGPDAGPDVGPDTGPDVGFDAGSDAGSDGGQADAGSDIGVDPQDGGSDAAGSDDTGGGGLAITAVSPSTIENDRSTELIIVGSGFEVGAQVLLGGESIGVTEVQSGRIRALVAEGIATGSYDVIVTNPGGETAILQDAVTVVEPGADTGVADTGGDIGAGNSDVDISHEVGGGDDTGSADQSAGKGAAEGGCGCRSVDTPVGVPTTWMWALGLLLAGGAFFRRRFIL